MRAIEAEVEALKSRAAALTTGFSGPALDSLDSLDPVFSDPADAPPSPDRAALLRTRERRLDLGLGVADLDLALADLDRAWAGSGLNPGTRPHPETPAPPASSPDPAPRSGVETARTS